MAYTTIDDPTIFFNTKLYTGNGGNQTITGVGFKPDWTWWKSRDAGNSHALVDIVRGTNGVLYSGSTSTEQPISAQTFNSDGYALVQDAGANSINSNGSTKVAWSWLAGGSQGSSNTDGSINTTYTSANTTSGFSISTYTGTGSNATVGHGLGAVPKVVLVKGIGHTSQWYMYHAGAGANKVGLLDNTAVFSTDTTSWQNTTPTSSVFSIGNDGGTNGGSNTYIAYCFAEKKGFSKFGSYVGNGEPIGDAPFIYTGFKPAFLLIKSSTYAESWAMTDNRRLGYNGSSAFLKADDPQAEATDLVNPNLLSNGFSLQNNDNVYNKNTQSYIYWAFAESPFVTSTGIPSSAG